MPWQQRRLTASQAIFTGKIARTSWEVATVLYLALATLLSAGDKRLLRWLGPRKEAEVAALVQHGED